jgi:hypothetical protein
MTMPAARQFSLGLANLGLALLLAGCAKPIAHDKPAPSLSGHTYHFEHLQSGARQLRGGAFPGDILLYPERPAGVTITPPGYPHLRTGTIRVPSSLLDGSAARGSNSNANGSALVQRALAIDDSPPGAIDDPIRFWLDTNGDGDLTNDAITPDAAPRPFARANPSLAGILGRLSTGTIQIAGRRHAYVTGRPIRSDNFYVFVSPTPVPDADSTNAAAVDASFHWESAIGFFLEAPPLVTHRPPDLSRPVFGLVRLGPADQQTRFVVIVEVPEPGSRESTSLYVDSNADGRFDEPPARLTKADRPTAIATPADKWTGTATVLVSYPSKGGTQSLPLDLALDFRIADSSGDASGAKSLSLSLTYRGEWGRRGTLRLHDRHHAALLFDDLGSGDYRGSQGGNDSGVRLLIDLDDNQKFERNEAFDIAQPIEVRGRRYRIEDMQASGESFRLVEVDVPTEEMRTQRKRSEDE